MRYVDGFVIPVRAADRQKYIELARSMAKVFKEFGATRVVECWGDDVPDGKVTDFRRAVKAEEGESVVFSWVEYPSKEVRDAANAKLKTDTRMKDVPMPFDGKRMIFGGFAAFIDE
jgi:uncharacterized protein YbaA (DUF1428 family)